MAKQFAPRRPTASAMRGSIGLRDGDYVELANKFARVTITHDVQSARYRVTGDTLQGEFETPYVGSAYSYAFESLDAYARGRAD